jgi:hypothetical protein
MAEDLPEDHRKDGRTAGRNNSNKSSTRRRRRERIKYYQRNGLASEEVERLRAKGR